jgi:ferredoxin-type protein NapH
MIKVKQLQRRQRIRQAMLLLSLLLFPVTLYYFSPALILQGASVGLINASAIVFGLMFLSSLFVGRLWCGWACPAGALQEIGMPINNKRTPGGKFNWVKWAVWIPWISLMVVLFVRAGGVHGVAPFLGLETHATLTQPLDGGGPPWFLIYYIIIALFLGTALVFGRRAGCHTICWMAPFMILGRRLRNTARWPSLRLQAEPDKCVHCLTCSRGCPMSLDVHSMVEQRNMEDGECILCGTCVDNCKKGAIRYTFSAR